MYACEQMYIYIDIDTYIVYFLFDCVSVFVWVYVNACIYMYTLLGHV